MKIAGIFLGVAVLVVIFVACVIARNRKAEAERKERLEHIFDDMPGYAPPKPKDRPAASESELKNVLADKKDTRTLDELEGEEKIEAIMAAWRASESYEKDMEYFSQKLDKIRKDIRK